MRDEKWGWSHQNPSSGFQDIVTEISATSGAVFAHQNQNANYVLISLGIGEKKVCIPTDFVVGISNMKSNFWKNHKKALKN